MEIQEGRVYGVRYYTVNPYPLTIPIWYKQSRSKWNDMENWCKETFGDKPVDDVWVPNARWYMNDSRFWFKHESDLTMFLLRWR